MASISATVGGNPLRGFQNFSFEIELGLGKRAKRATCRVLYDTDAYADAKAESGQVLRILIDGVEKFEGPIAIVGDKWLNPLVYEVTIDATDWTPFLDAHLVHTENLEDGSLPEQTLLERVNWILVTFCSGFTLGSIENNATLKAQAIDRTPASVVFDELAELTDQVFDLSFDKSVTFSQTGDVAPIAAIDVDTDLTVSDVEVTEDWSDLHNVLLIKEFKLRSAYRYEEEFTADGFQSFFKLSMPPWSTSETIVSISKAGGADGTFTDRVSIVDSLGNQSEWELYRGAGTEDDAEETIRLMDLEEERQGIIDGVAGEVYICLWNQGIRFPKIDMPDDGDVIRVRYPFERPQQTLEVRDLTSIMEIASREGTDGIHQKIISIPELRAVSLLSAVDYAMMLLQRGAWPVLTGSFQTYVTGWEARQRFTIVSAIRDIDDPRNDGDPAEVWISKVIMTVTGLDNGNSLVDHMVEFTSLPYAVPIPMDEMIWRLIDRTSWLRPPGTTPPAGTDYTTSTSTSTTTTVTSTSTTTTESLTSTSTTTTQLPWPILLEETTPSEIGGMKITDLENMEAADGTELFTLVSNPTGKAQNLRVAGDYLPLRAQVMFTVPGALAVDPDAAPWFICSAPAGLSLLGVGVTAKTAPVGDDIIIDIELSAAYHHPWGEVRDCRRGGFTSVF